MRTEDIYAWLAERLRDDGELHRSDVEEALGERTEDALFFLEFLVTRGVVTSQRQASATVYRLADHSSFDELVAAYMDDSGEDRGTVDGSRRGDLPEGRQLVVSVPLDLQPQVETLREEHGDIDVLTLRRTVGTLLDAAESEVWLAVPFFEQSGLNTILDEVTALASRGVDLRVLTRDVRKGEGYNHTNKCRALAKLSDLYTANQQVDGSIEIRDFGSEISGHPDNPSRHYRGVHQKMIVTDDTAAYVGSGEIRENSFLTNGEAGTLTVNEAEVAFWRDFFVLFWQQAASVDETVVQMGVP